MLNRLAVLGLGFLVCGCAGETATGKVFEDVVDGLTRSGSPTKSGRSTSLALGSDGGNVFGGKTELGSGVFVSSRAPSVSFAELPDGTQGYTVNLLNAPISQATKSVLGDILGLSYTINPDVNGTISLQTASPVSRDELVELFEAALAVSSASIVRSGAGYRVVPSASVLSANPAVSVPSVSPRGPGVVVQVIELQHIDASEMATILQPIARDGSILRVDSKRNHIVVAGTQADLRSIRDSIAVFDVDWMRGRSVALHPLQSARPNDVVRELEAIFGVNSDNIDGRVRFIANSRLNSVLVISNRPAYIERAAGWIRQLDTVASTSQDQLFVYKIQNRPAKELATVLQSVLGGDTSIGNDGSASGETPVAPDLDPVTVTTGDLGDNVLASGGSKIPSVVADIENNALLISTTAAEFKRIERILHQLDVLPTQVLIEAVIAEVSLNDELKFGVRWAVESGSFSFGLSDLVNGFAGASFPGASWGFATKDVQVTLNALASITDVNVVSSPTIMALNNQRAVLQVGDQVPIVTQQTANVVTANASVVNSISLRDTGIILSVVPRVNSSGRVLLDIEQEVSGVVQTTTSGIDSPTIQQRKISTKVVVNNGESLALGGLIQERNSLQRGQVPLLGNVPIIGNAFKNKTDTISKTELIIFIKPSIVTSVDDARSVTAEFRDKLGLGSALDIRRGGTPLQQDLKRLRY